MISEEKIPNINSIEEKQDIARQIQITNPIQNLPQNTQINDINPNALPLDVTKDLAQYSKIFVTKEYDYFKVVHFFENYLHDYKVFGELPDGDKKLLFTVSKHFECKLCCDNCIMTCCCCSYVFCNSIIFQFDYKRNGKPFFTQGLNLQSGCYCCQCYCCSCCSCCTRSSYLRLRENIDPNNPDANVGIYKGVTKVTTCCIVPELTANYIKNDDSNGPGIRAKCWDVIRKRCLKCLKKRKNTAFVIYQGHIMKLICQLWQLLSRNFKLLLILFISISLMVLYNNNGFNYFILYYNLYYLLIFEK